MKRSLKRNVLSVFVGGIALLALAALGIGSIPWISHAAEEAKEEKAEPEKPKLTAELDLLRADLAKLREEQADGEKALKDVVAKRQAAHYLHARPVLVEPVAEIQI